MATPVIIELASSAARVVAVFKCLVLRVAGETSPGP